METRVNETHDCEHETSQRHRCQITVTIQQQYRDVMVVVRMNSKDICYCVMCIDMTQKYDTWYRVILSYSLFYYCELVLAFIYELQ